MKIKKIVVACGSGVATSQTVVSKLEDLLSARGIKANCEAIDMKGLDTTLKNADIYVSITPGFKPPVEIPTFNGIPFLTGMGMEAELEKIIEEIQRP